MTFHDSGCTRFCSRDSSVMNGAGKRSARVESIWQSFTNVTPASLRARRSADAVSGSRSAASRRKPRTWDAKPWRPKMRMMAR